MKFHNPIFANFLFNDNTKELYVKTLFFNDVSTKSYIFEDKIVGRILNLKDFSEQSIITVITKPFAKVFGERFK